MLEKENDLVNVHNATQISTLPCLNIEKHKTET